MKLDKYYGKHRAVVVSSDDPEKRGRIIVSCPKIYGSSPSPYCLPSSPSTEFICIPKAGSMVWIEFEEGDTSKPIYSGSIWTLNSIEDVTKHTISNGNVKIVLDRDTIELEHASGPKIVVDSEGVKLQVNDCSISLNLEGLFKTVYVSTAKEIIVREEESTSE